MADTNYLNWPFFEPRHRELALALDAWAAEHIGQDHGADVDAACRALVAQLGEAGWLRHAVGGRVRRRGRGDRHARHLPDPRNAGAPFRPGRLRVRDAGPGQRRDHPVRQRSEPRALPAEGGRGEAIAAFALSEPDAGSDVAAHAVRGAARRRRTMCWTAKRPGSRTAASPTCTWCSRAPAKRRARAASRPSSSTPTCPASRSPSAST